MANIVIVGAGQIGSRHLQGLSRIDRDSHILVIDPSHSSLEKAQKRFEEMPPSDHIVSLKFNTVIENSNSNFDVAIIATTADIRREAIEELVNTVNVQNLIIEKVAFQSIEDYSIILHLLDRKGIKAWVNFPRRMYPVYKSLKKTLESPRDMYFELSGGNWHLTSNALHLLDLLSFLTNEQEISLDSTGLNEEILETNRPGFVNFSGFLRGKSKNGVEIQFLETNSSLVPDVLHILTKESRFLICEAKGVLFRMDAANNFEWIKDTLKIPFQSELTNLAVQQILDNGECDLTTLKESYPLHKVFLSAISDHFFRISGRKHTKLPIT
jgi:hypothetical protein